MTETRWKFFRLRDKAIWSSNGNCCWKVGAWKQTISPLEMCWNGFHCSQLALDAFGYVSGEVVGRVEVEGRSIRGDDKEVWERARLTSAWEWREQDARALADHVASVAIPLYESVCSYNTLARQAWEAAKRYHEIGVGLTQAELKREALIDFVINPDGNTIRRRAAYAVNDAASVYLAFDANTIRRQACSAAYNVCQAVAYAQFGSENGNMAEWPQAYYAARVELDQWMTAYIRENCPSLVPSH